MAWTQLTKLGRGVGHSIAVATLALGASLAPATAQNLFEPVAKVNNEAVTAYERNQRMAFMTLLRAPGDVRELVMDQLINEKLQLAEAERLGVEPDPEAVRQGMEEFASRGNLSVEQFLEMIGQAGIAAETFRDFVTAGITWREVARELFLEKVTITESEIDRAYAEAEPTPGQKFLLTEIVLPASSAASLKASRMRAERLAQIQTADEFSDAAKRFSIAPTRLNNGERDWVDLQALPAPVQAAIRNVGEGATSRPVVLGEDGVAVYFVRDRETVRTTNVGTLIDYAAFFIPGGRSQAALAEAAEIRAEVQVCDDLYPIARGLPTEQLVREEIPSGAVPANFKAELDNMDPGEISTNLTTSSGSLVVLMLCNRRNDVPDSVSRTQVAESLRNQRIGALANDYLAELRANAVIEYYD